MQTKITEAIFEKVPLLTEEQQREILEMTEKLLNREKRPPEQLERPDGHPLTLLGEIQIDFEHDDLAERHDFYAHGKIED